jgi:NAD(P)H dehydrogenase (quinone)
MQGLCSAGHYGPVAIGSPDERIEKEVEVLVEKFAALVAKL